MKKGVPVSPGVAVARAFCVEPILTRRDPHLLDAAALYGEVNRFDRACSAAARELDAIAVRVARQIGESEAAIFRAHRLLIDDPTLTSKVKTAILGRRVDAITALQETLDEYRALLEGRPDPVFQARLADLRDVVGRLAAKLTDENTRPASYHGEHPVIVVAAEILPSQALAFDRMLIAGLLTEAGAADSHTAILARSMGIPAVGGVSGLMREVHNGDLIALDGRAGHVYVNPGPETEAAYRKLQREYAAAQVKLVENAHLDAVTPDGAAVELLANVNGPDDARTACRVGACGVGLYRTEYLFLAHPSVPDEDEQLATYRAVIEAAPNRTVTIRTLDLGGDKNVPYLGQHKEANPFLGWRSTRLSAAYPEFFQTQLRAILRATAHGKVSLLIPMISQVEELQRVKRMLRRVREALARRGQPVGDDVPLGVMVEVPAAALCIHDLLDEADFVSIGSNDLVQYLMAADRDNPRVAHLCEPFNPALFRLLRQVIRACDDRGKPVTLCGEMAGRPRCLPALLGMGLRRLSMSPSLVPQIKELTRRTPMRTAQEVAEHVLTLRKAGEIKGYLTHKIRQLWPSVALLDTRR